MANNEVMSTQDTLLAYSEWLDSQGLMAPCDGDHRPSPDTRSHDDLACEFITHWESDKDRATLAGRVGAKMAKAFESFVADVQAALDKQS